MNEFELIRRLTARLPGNESVVIGPGDDCAVLDLGLPDRLILFKTDAVVEGVHFRSDTSPVQVGYKALARCLSDIAAMAGQPGSALVTLGLPAGFDVAWVDKVYEGLVQLATRYGVAIVGGETTKVPHGALISIALLGTVGRERCLRRSGARSGDAIFVTGTLGGSLSGKHLDFQPRLAEAEWLSARFQIHAMIDLSDGLAGDLRHVTETSGVGAILRAESIPISQAARLQARAGTSAKPALVAALTDGEDFELLFTLASREAVPLLDQWKVQFPDLPLTCIGKIQAEHGITLQDRNGARALNVHGYAHFS